MISICRNGSGTTELGVFKTNRRNGKWELDLDVNGVWDSWHGDPSVNLGSRGDTRVVGDRDGSGTVKVGVFGEGVWQLDCNGNGVWDGESVDREVMLGHPGDKPVVHRW